MSIATDLQTIAENTPLVYEAGKQKQYDDFWNTYQEYNSSTGTVDRKDYQFAFAGNGWTDELINPKYPVIPTGGVNAGRQMFYLNKVVKNISADIRILGSVAANVFNGCNALESINKITIDNTTTFATWFTSCAKLENIVIEGTINNNFDISPTKVLNIESCRLLLSLLSTSGSSKTMTFSSSLKSAIESDNICVGYISTATTNGWTIAFA